MVPSLRTHGPTGRRERNRAAQRARVLEAARELFGTRGLDAVTMAELAAEAGVSRATVFNHFGSKHALVEAITVDVLEQYQQELDHVLADEETPVPDQIRHLFDFMGLGVEAQRRFHHAIFREIARMLVGLDEGGAGHAVRRRNMASIMALMQRGQARGEITSGERAEDLARAFDSLAFGTITLWLYDEPSPALRERMRRAAGILLAPIETAPVRQRRRGRAA